MKARRIPSPAPAAAGASRKKGLETQPKPSWGARGQCQSPWCPVIGPALYGDRAGEALGWHLHDLAGGFTSVEVRSCTWGFLEPCTLARKLDVLRLRCVVGWSTRFLQGEKGGILHVMAISQLLEPPPQPGWGWGHPWVLLLAPCPGFI